MKKENNENLGALFAQFLDAEQAAKAVADIAAGKQIFDANPAPTPSPSLLADITRQMAAKGKKRRWVRYFTRRIAAAAVIFLVLGIAAAMLQRHASQLTSESFWQGTQENSIDAQLTQLDQAENDAPVITLEVNGTDLSPMNDITDELNEIEGTFWEG
jgi:hypothetical protein